MGVDYLNNEILESAIAEYHKCKANPKINKENYEKVRQDLAEFFYLLSDQIIKAFKFQFIDEEDARQEGVAICFEKLDRFDFKRGSKAFNYLTTVTLNHFRQLYRTAKNYNELKRKFAEHQISKINEELLHKLHTKYKQYLTSNNEED